jgi:hypothetical protein
VPGGATEQLALTLCDQGGDEFGVEIHRATQRCAGQSTDQRPSPEHIV